MLKLLFAAPLALLFVCTSCKKSEPEPTAAEIQTGSELVNENCVSCHEAPAPEDVRQFTGIPSWEAHHGRPSVVDAEQMRLILAWANATNSGK